MKKIKCKNEMEELAAAEAAVIGDVSDDEMEVDAKAPAGVLAEEDDEDSEGEWFRSWIQEALRRLADFFRFGLQLTRTSTPPRGVTATARSRARTRTTRTRPCRMTRRPRRKSRRLTRSGGARVRLRRSTAWGLGVGRFCIRSGLGVFLSLVATARFSVVCTHSAAWPTRRAPAAFVRFRGRCSSAIREAGDGQQPTPLAWLAQLSELRTFALEGRPGTAHSTDHQS